MFGMERAVGRIVAGIIALCVIVCLVLLLGYCQARKEARTAKSEGRVATATGKALDRVSEQSEGIRADQKEKERGVDTIEGSDQRLPDGFGAELERVRKRGGERKDSR